MERNKANSPAEIEVLLHYHSSPGQHRLVGNDNFKKSFDAFVNYGLLIPVNNGYKANTPALSRYIEKLLEVEFPTQQWV